MSEARRDATHAAGHAENAGDHAESITGAQCSAVAGVARGRATGGRVELLAALRGGRAWVPADASAELVAQFEERGCEVVRSVWVEVVTWEQAES
jgi:hypothetical protein